MRHRIAGRILSRTSSHRLAMRRNLACSLFEHETISTTMEKAKETKVFAEKLITLAKKGTLSARRRAISLLGDRDIISSEEGKEVRKNTVIGKLFSEIGPRYLDRPGGYTRIIRISLKRLGDNGQLVLLQLVGQEESAARSSKAASKKRSKKKPKSSVEAEQADEGAEATEVVVAEEDEETSEEKNASDKEKSTDETK